MQAADRDVTQDGLHHQTNAGPGGPVNTNGVNNVAEDESGGNGGLGVNQQRIMSGQRLPPQHPFFSYSMGGGFPPFPPYPMYPWYFSQPPNQARNPMWGGQW